MDVTVKDVQAEKRRYGHVLKSFVFGELFKYTTSADDDYRLLYYPDADDFEVEVVMENTGGQLIGVEVKASATVKERDLRGLKNSPARPVQHVLSLISVTVIVINIALIVALKVARLAELSLVLLTAVILPNALGLLSGDHVPRLMGYGPRECIRRRLRSAYRTPDWPWRWR
jgi:Domain of unknown function (DUF4143)